MLLQLTSTSQVSAGPSQVELGFELLLQAPLFLMQCVSLADLTRAVNALPQNMTSQMFSAIAAVTGQGQNPNATPAQWGSSQYGYGGSGGGSSAYHVGVTSISPVFSLLLETTGSLRKPSLPEVSKSWFCPRGAARAGFLSQVSFCLP